MFMNLSDEELKGMKYKFSGLLDGKSEPSVYPIICESMNEALNLAAQHRKDDVKYRFMDISEWPESNANDLKIDIAIQKSHLEDSSRQTHVGRNAWAWMTAGVEVKYTIDHSAFLFDDISLKAETPVLRNSKKGKKSWDAACRVRYRDDGRMSDEELGCDTTAVLATEEEVKEFVAVQPRNKYAAERAKKIIDNRHLSQSIQGSDRVHFIGKHSAASSSLTGRATKGCNDSTAVLTTEEEVKELVAVQPRNKYAAERAKEIIGNRVFYAIYKVICHNASKGSDSVHFIGKHSAASSSLTGRATKGYVTFNMGAKDVGGPRL
ncbi:hypothetical protein BDY19DRAFT_991550 [Irpex rosettiformis]|uniref:Uncharacterized protein n=1 Tax=Irpex rosettiformis TaxID=378272 RepID=A0ACB8U984_9APHY|nr:hypothetical protein BDY19DRAFT_991550 [Irpex rosettiformis]